MVAVRLSADAPARLHSEAIAVDAAAEVGRLVARTGDDLVLWSPPDSEATLGGVTALGLDTDATVRPSLVPATAWLVVASAAAIVVPIALGASLPLLSYVWLVIAAVVLRRHRTPAALGIVLPPRRELVRVTAVATVGMTLLFGTAEALTHPYRELLALIREEAAPDSTFAWVLEYGRGWGLVGFAVYGALVTMFSEEVVFRGALMHSLRTRGRAVAVAGTTFAFTVPQLLPAALLPFDAAMGFLLLDAVLAVGVVGGLAAYRTRSILPGLVAITVANLVVLAAVA